MELDSNSFENEKYEQFETMDINDQLIKRHKKKSSYYPKKIINSLLLIVSILCIMIVIYQFLQSEKILTNNSSEIYESKKEDTHLSNSESQKCGPGYKFVDNKCVINHSIRAEYHTEKKDEKIKLIHILPDLPIEMIVDGEKVETCKEFTFPKEGNHTVFFLADLLSPK